MDPVDSATDHFELLNDEIPRDSRREAYEVVLWRLVHTAPEQVTSAIRHYLGMDDPS